ncbi:Protein kinase domain protein [Kalmanozyma brasiliensis GHG001]|uniref:Protein kinase n=1 Tax=Kalmanozyma brasiliensis (strain GHG001) TaxID=1365824 RepID=V5EUH0_KALBG|nr:Protein kinase domain protein [Kalmanozyma brasiliensis GHG001]EST05764.1 Protein kinase domain protein [Kalmanozyma brasiliensis GHG001]
MPLLDSFDPSQTISSSRTRSQKRSLIAGSSFHDSYAATEVNWDGLTQHLVSHSHGLVSSVYRCKLSPYASWPYQGTSSTLALGLTLAEDAESAEGLPGWVCIKRVAVDEQPRPHSVAREIALLDRLPPHRNITPLLAALYDTSDPFGAVMDLVMPLYAATLEEVLQEPSLIPSLAAAEGSLAETPRPGNSIQHLWSSSPPSFIHSVATQLLDGIAFLHEHKIAHRDIKPSNILLSHNGTLKLIDLGTAYTTTPLRNPLPDEDMPLDDEAKQMVCQVGTGEFRAPELLFSPLGGYDAFAVDVWAAAVTLAHFFTPLTAIPTITTSDFPSLDVEHDERKDWQRAFDSNTPLPDEGDSPLYFEEDPYPQDDPSQGGRSESGYIRTPLFEADRGDIGLAASIFALLGLPMSIQDWPEAEHFQPRLERMPFAATEGKDLLTALPLFQPEEGGESGEVVQKVIVPALQLSTSKRPKAQELLNALRATGPAS